MDFTLKRGLAALALVLALVAAANAQPQRRPAKKAKPPAVVIVNDSPIEPPAAPAPKAAPAPPAPASGTAPAEPAAIAEPAPPAPSLPPALPDPAWAPDRVEPGSQEKIREYTTAPEFLPESTAYVPDSDTVPSPEKVLGHLAGAPDQLSRTADLYGYFRRLDEASDRVRVETLGKTEEGREILVVAVSDAANLANLDRLKQVTAALADPRRTPRAEALQLVQDGKVFYWLTGGLHSAETGSPEMLMELAYRLAVSERAEIRSIRQNVVVLITPVTEPDGRDRMVDWYYRHLKGRKLSWEEGSEIDSPPYWGHYVFHDNNRDQMQLTQALSRAVNEGFFAYHPQVMHDLHESVPLLYISTGTGPYSRAADPVTVNEWTQLGYHEAGRLAAQGLPGVWTWGFWDGWWPGYLVSVATNHNGVGRFYETFGNASAATFERDLSDYRFAGKNVTDLQWYRPWPPAKKVRWSLRNNTNYMQAGVLAALEYAALHRAELLESFWLKGERAIERGKSEAPYAWAFGPDQRDPARLAHLIHQLRAHRIEVQRLTAEKTFGGKRYPVGSFLVRMDQPYRNLALTFLEEQKFPPDEPNPPYDDVAWTWPLLYGVEGAAISDKAALEAPVEPLETDLAAVGSVGGVGDLYLLRDTGQTSLLAARVQLGGSQVDAAEAAFTLAGVTYPPGSWIVQAPRETVETVAREAGLSFTATSTLPDVARHPVDLPRLALYHSWIDTQDAGWARYTLERQKVEFALLNDDDLKRGGLRERYDVILLPNTRGSFAALVHGIDPKYGPLAYTRTEEFPSHGIPDASPDITGGMGFEGLLNLQHFVNQGGVLLSLANAGTLVVDGGLVRQAARVPPGGFNTPGSEVRARVLRPTHPIAYGYEEKTSVFRGNGPIYDVEKWDRSRVVLQFGLKLPDADEEPKKEAAPGDGKVEVEDVDLGPGAKAEAKAEKPEKADKAEKPEDKKLVLSGFVKGEDVVNGKPAILDLPVGKGRVVLYAFNPLHRYLNLSDFRLLFNAILNWNDLPQ